MLRERHQRRLTLEMLSAKVDHLVQRGADERKELIEFQKGPAPKRGHKDRMSDHSHVEKSSPD
jgi:hypothetical protein